MYCMYENGNVNEDDNSWFTTVEYFYSVLKVRSSSNSGKCTAELVKVSIS